MFRESAHVYERRDGWARISEPHLAACIEGRSDYVDTGDARCVADNGVEGRFAEWVRLSHPHDNSPGLSGGDGDSVRAPRGTVG